MNCISLTCGPGEWGEVICFEVTGPQVCPPGDLCLMSHTDMKYEALPSKMTLWGGHECPALTISDGPRALGLTTCEQHLGVLWPSGVHICEVGLRARRAGRRRGNPSVWDLKVRLHSVFQGSLVSRAQRVRSLYCCPHPTPFLCTSVSSGCLETKLEL